jgi:hypothetical protein
MRYITQNRAKMLKPTCVGYRQKELNNVSNRINTQHRTLPENHFSD